jgi:hypothetical protein
LLSSAPDRRGRAHRAGHRARARRGADRDHPESQNTEFLTYLGFRINPKVTALAKRPGEQVPISAEQLPIIDSDVLVFATDEATPTPRSAARCTSSAR